MDQVEQIDTYLMLGIGEVHGRDGVNWLLNHIQKDYALMENGTEKRVKPFSHGKRSTFHHSIGKRTAYRFNLADQHILQQTVDVTKTSSRFFMTQSWRLSELSYSRSLDYPICYVWK